MTEAADQPYDWNGATGESWVENQALLDAMFAPVRDRLLETVPQGADEAILDIGCGTGDTSWAIAARTGLGGHVTGIDISEPMTAVARQRAIELGARTDFVVADAQRYDFGGARFDRLVSRFGVMFFDDPVAAFANLRGATRPGGTMHFLTWREPKDNGFMIASGRAARAFFPDMPRFDPAAPGQFGLADPDRINTILAASGWSEAQLTPLDISCHFPRADLDLFIRRIGPVGRLIADLDAARQDEIIAAIRPAFDPFLDGDTVRYNAACWMIEAAIECAEFDEKVGQSGQSNCQL